MKQRDLFILFGSSCIVVIAWIVFTLINKSVTSTVKEEVLLDVKPITGTFDHDTLNLLKSRQSVQPVYSVQTQISVSPAPTVTPSNPALRTTSPTPTPINGVSNASGSANIRI